MLRIEADRNLDEGKRAGLKYLRTCVSRSGQRRLTRVLRQVCEAAISGSHLQISALLRIGMES